MFTERGARTTRGPRAQRFRKARVWGPPAAALAVLTVLAAGCHPGAHRALTATSSSSTPAATGSVTSPPSSTSAPGASAGSTAPTRSSTTTSSQQYRADRAAFTARADTACAGATRQLSVLPAAAGPAQLVTFLGAQLAVEQQLLAQLQRLTAPAADRVVVQARWLQPYRQAIGLQRQLLPGITQAISGQDDVRLAALHTQYQAVSHPAGVAAFVRSYGLTACAGFDSFHAP